MRTRCASSGGQLSVTPALMTCSPRIPLVASGIRLIADSDGSTGWWLLINKATRYSRAWRIALCGPRNSESELPLQPHNVEYRLEKAWLAGYSAAKKELQGHRLMPAAGKDSE